MKFSISNFNHKILNLYRFSLNVAFCRLGSGPYGTLCEVYRVQCNESTVCLSYYPYFKAKTKADLEKLSNSNLVF